MGQPRPEAVKEKIRAAWTSEKRAEHRKKYVGSNNPNFGKTHDKETRQRISMITKERMTPEIRAYLSELSKARVGKLSSNWKGGRYIYWQYPSEFNDELKERIRRRDNYTCQHCRTTHNKTNNWNLDIHHRDGNRFNNNEDNLITLCRSCHKIADANLKAEKEVMVYDGNQKYR